jgi:hypothetical protein
MKKIIFIFFLGFAASFVRAQEGTTTYTWYPASALKITSHMGRISASVEKGDSIVFVYEFRKKDDPAIADDEYTLQVLFAIPANKKSFKYAAKEIPVVLLKGCFCTDGGYHYITSGFVSGKKKCGSWTVKWHLETKTMPDAESSNFVQDVSACFKKGAGKK